MTTTTAPKLDSLVSSLRQSSWTRSASDAKIAGVASCLARKIGVDVQFVRIGFVVAAFLGFGVLAYLTAWVLMPRDSDGSLVLDEARKGKFISAVLVGLVALGILAPMMGRHMHVVPMLAVGVGIWYFVRKAKSSPAAVNAPYSSGPAMPRIDTPTDPAAGAARPANQFDLPPYQPPQA